MLRAVTDPGGLDLPDHLDLDGPDAAESGLRWVSRVWERDVVRAALAQASPALSRRIDTLVAEGGDVRAVRRVVLTLASYLLRWQLRPTPFGVFAGVAPVRIGTGATARWGAGHTAVARADGAWLDDVLSRLHRCPELLDRLHVVANNAGMVRGARFVVPGTPPPDPGLAPVEVSVRHSRPVQAVLDAARTPIRFGDLRNALRHRFPDTAPDRIDHLLDGLLTQGVLLSDLRAPMTTPDALGRVCSILDSVDASGIPVIAPLVDELASIHRELSARQPAAAGQARVTARMRAVSRAAEVPVMVDTVLDCDLRLPHQIAREAADAATVLLRLSPYRFGRPEWREYHSAFRARYGTGALVPLPDLLADSGLELPAGYLGSGRDREARRTSGRDETILALIQRAAVDGTDEILLTDRILDELTGSDPGDTGHLPDRLEIAVQILATDLDAMETGRFLLTVTGTPRPGSSMTGRHAHLLSDDARDNLAATFTADGTGSVAAQLSFPPRRRRNDNVARTTRLLPHTIALAEHHAPDPHLIQPGDLAVTVDEHRFHLIHLPTGRRVAPRVTHALEATVHTPPIARFLADITDARAAVYGPFSFGAASRLPRLPRVRYRRTILAPARWTLTTADLPGRDTPMPDWDTELDAWRQRWRAPRQVAVVDHDRRQPLDLTHPLHRRLLRSRLDRAGRLELRETPAPADHGWLGRVHEVVFRLTSTQPTPAPPVPVTERNHAVDPDAGHLPGRFTVLCAHLHGHPARADDILTDHLPELLTALDPLTGGDPVWWFRRHRRMRHPDADRYLALHLRVPADGYGEAAAVLAAWGRTLSRDKLLAQLSLTTYEPQTGRYGHGIVLDRAHEVFAADSAAALAQITTAARAGVSAQALAAASMVDLTLGLADTTDAALDRLRHTIPRGRLRPDRTVRDQALAWADPTRSWTCLRALPGSQAVVAAWQARAQALTVYRDALAAQRDPFTVVPALLHSHHNRAVGVDPAVEHATGHLVRACALHYLHTTGTR
ncbi:lantibiotic dehydratase [Actinosynnema sp. NPDC050436]|uniref:lantibiotic dehydratase n=1 Tax=Actinosynnema sp. NPDC050436 TaxID=3155659 RepID=UPI0033ED71CB